MAETKTRPFEVLNEPKVKKRSEVDRRLPSWLSNPTQFPAVNLLDSGQDIEEFADYIDEDILRHIKKVMLIDRMFPVQKCLIPHLTNQFRSRHYKRPNDICVSSPTGSGKTLAFVIPIVNYLKQSIDKSLKALVMLPSRDLAQQVHKAFQQVCASTHLRCGLAAGANDNKGFFKSSDKLKPSGSGSEAEFGKELSLILRHHGRIQQDKTDYVSMVDILVSTPGVLIDLLHNSPGFSLANLEILVIDEADKLMMSHKHDWLKTIEQSVFDATRECPCKKETTPTKSESLDVAQAINGRQQRVCYTSSTSCVLRHSNLSKPLHKLLFSATLSSDPQILMHMNLFQPCLFIATKPSITSMKIRHSLGSAASTPSSSPQPPIKAMVNTKNELLTSSAIPEQLEEKMFITEEKEKMFVMWYLFHELKLKNVICFTNQKESTRFKLCKFLNEVHGVRAVEYSSNLKQETRQKFLNEFKEGRIDVFVGTDMMSRGMDIEGIDYVISYDLPMTEVNYIHRVGRTARAGKKGTAITLVDTKQLVMFKRIVRLAHKMPNSMRLSDVVEEMKVPFNIKKNSTKYDIYLSTYENYEDKLNSCKKQKDN